MWPSCAATSGSTDVIHRTVCLLVSRQTVTDDGGVTDYQVVCVTLLHPAQHRHILGIGTVNSYTPTRWSVDDVWSAIGRGDRFYTNDSRGRRALVERWECRTCGLRTLRTRPDAVTDNNLDQLQQC
ncbi:MAG: hypothetical protein QOI15_2770 [Pseudonocardiales bacterium]|nr:hypothetical protein [Pseudonocardiales bacterium]